MSPLLRAVFQAVIAWLGKQTPSVAWSGVVGTTITQNASSLPCYPHENKVSWARRLLVYGQVSTPDETSW